MKRGNIFDANGIKIATSTLESNGEYLRRYPYNESAVHITGYSDHGKTNLEALYNFELLTLENEVWQRMGQVVFDKELIGNSIELTIDMKLQEYAGELLGEHNGAIVVLNPETGGLLALQSYPNFNPNTVSLDWDTLKSDENSPLLSRATQGTYPPGSTFKVITALSIMRNIPNWQNIAYYCSGNAEFEDKVIHCAYGAVHGDMTLETALKYSCNTYFAEMTTRMSAEVLRENMVASGMSESSIFELNYKSNNVGLTKTSSESELVETAIGQGKTTVTPLYMAMLAGAIANDGVMMKPYLVERVIDYQENIKERAIPESLITIATPEEMKHLTEMMELVVLEGTGQKAQVEGVSIAGKTGTAQNATGKDHSWFIAFAPADEPAIAIAVLVEDMEEAGSAVPIAQKLIEYVF